MKKEKKHGKIGISRFFAPLTLQALLYKNLPAFFLETSISENMDDLKGRDHVIIIKNKTLFAIKYTYLG